MRSISYLRYILFETDVWEVKLSTIVIILAAMIFISFGIAGGFWLASLMNTARKELSSYCRLLALLSPPALRGVTLAVALATLPILVLYVVIGDSSVDCFDRFSGNFVTKSYASDLVRNGRFGLSLCVLGVLMLAKALSALTPKTQKRNRFGDHNLKALRHLGSRNLWRNTDDVLFRYCTLLVVIYSLFIVFFTFSSEYSSRLQLIYLIIITILSETIKHIVSVSLCSDRLLSTPIVLLCDMITLFAARLAAITLYQLLINHIWILCFRLFINLYATSLGKSVKAAAITSICASPQNCFINICVVSVTRVVTATPVIIKSFVRLLKSLLCLNGEQVSAVYAGLQNGETSALMKVLKKQIAEAMESQSDENGAETVEPVIDTLHSISVDFMSNILSFFMILFLWAFSKQLQADSYGHVKTVHYPIYLLFALFSLIAVIIVQPLLLSAIELKQNSHVYHYLVYVRYKFITRKFRWAINEPQQDESIDVPYRRLDLTCFSEQFYFISSMATISVLLFIWGVQMCLINNYAPFVDEVALLVILLVCGVYIGVLVLYGCIWSAQFRGKSILWPVKHSNYGVSSESSETRDLPPQKLVAGDCDDLTYLCPQRILELLILWAMHPQSTSEQPLSLINALSANEAKTVPGENQDLAQWHAFLDYRRERAEVLCGLWSCNHHFNIAKSRLVPSIDDLLSETRSLCHSTIDKILRKEINLMPSGDVANLTTFLNDDNDDHEVDLNIDCSLKAVVEQAVCLVLVLLISCAMLPVVFGAFTLTGIANMSAPRGRACTVEFCVIVLSSSLVIFTTIGVYLYFDAISSFSLSSWQWICTWVVLILLCSALFYVVCRPHKNDSLERRRWRRIASEGNVCMPDLNADMNTSVAKSMLATHSSEHLVLDTAVESCSLVPERLREAAKMFLCGVLNTENGPMLNYTQLCAVLKVEPCPQLKAAFDLCASNEVIDCRAFLIILSNHMKCSIDERATFAFMLYMTFSGRSLMCTDTAARDILQKLFLNFNKNNTDMNRLTSPEHIITIAEANNMVPAWPICSYLTVCIEQYLLDARADDLNVAFRVQVDDRKYDEAPRVMKFNAHSHDTILFEAVSCSGGGGITVLGSVSILLDDWIIDQHTTSASKETSEVFGFVDYKKELSDLDASAISIKSRREISLASSSGQTIAHLRVSYTYLSPEELLAACIQSSSSTDTL